MEKKLPLKSWISSLTAQRNKSREIPAAHITMFIYLLTLLGLALSRGLGSLVILYVGLMALLFLAVYLERFPFRSLLNFLGKIFLISLISLEIFSSQQALIPHINPTLYDQALMSLDIQLFGYNPVLWVAENLNNPWLTEWLQLSYVSYFFFVYLVVVISYTKEVDPEVNFAVFSIIFCFLLSYAGYFIIPAYGPRDVVDEPALRHLLYLTYPENLPSFGLAPHLRELLNNLERLKINAFPSGHTALTLLALRHFFRFSKKLFFYLLPLGLSIIAATIYCRYHYVMDLIGGVALFLFVCLIDRRVFAWHRALSAQITPWFRKF